MSSKPVFDLNTNPDDFKVIQLLGCGAFGQVFEMVHVPTQKHYAGKLFTELDEQAMEDVMKEIKIMSSVNCQYTLNIYGMIKFPKANPHYTIIMDYCDRGSLRDILDFNEVTLDEDQISIVMHDLLSGLAHLHSECKIIHRDIKAANILMSSDCSLKITDFGVSRQFENSASKFNTTSTMGTPNWMAPEVILAESYSFPVDIWSVGATAVELLEGAPPYYEFPANRAMNEIVATGFPGFRSDTVASNELKDFILSCMIYKAQKRPTAQQLLNHPFVKRAEKLDRKEILKDMVENEINFCDLIADDDINFIKQIVDFEVEPTFDSGTNKSETTKTMKTFVTQVEPHTNIKTIYHQ